MLSGTVSGPSDRDESVASLKPFRDMAEGLAKKGIAVYRFDKRSYVYGTQMMAASPRPLDELMREQYDFLYSLMPEMTIPAIRGSVAPGSRNSFLCLR